MINGIKPNISNTTKTEKTTTKNGLSFDKAMDNLPDLSDMTPDCPPAEGI